MGEKTCTKCKWLRKYATEDGRSWLNICEAEEPDEEDEGLYRVAAVDTEGFDASFCLNFKKRDEVR